MKTITNRDQPQELSTDIHVITAEINAYKRIAGEAIFEIGRRLKHVKENDLVHGEFGKWLESIEIDRTLATRLMKVADEFIGDYATWHKLPIRVLYEIATIPPEQRERPHAIPSTGEIKMVDDMTVRELREVKKALKEAEARAQKAEEDYKVVRETLESIESQPQPEPIVIEKPVYQVREVFPANVQSRIDEVERRLEEAESERDEAEASLSKTLARIQELERIERSVNATKDSPLYNLYRSLAGANGYLSALSDNVSESSALLAEANQDVIDKLKIELTLMSRLVGNVAEMLRTNRTTVIDIQEQKYEVIA